MLKHIREVEEDLLAAHKERAAQEQEFDHFGEKQGSIPIFFYHGIILGERREAEVKHLGGVSFDPLV